MALVSRPEYMSACAPARSHVLKVGQIQHPRRRFWFAGGGIGDGRWPRLLIAQLIIVQGIPGGRTTGADLHKDIIEDKGVFHFGSRDATTAREIQRIIAAQIGPRITASGPAPAQMWGMVGLEAETHQRIPVCPVHIT